MKKKLKKALKKASKKLRRHAPAADFSPVDDYFWLQHLLRLFPTLNLWVIKGDGRKLTRWWQMTPVGLRLEPFHFEPPQHDPRARYMYQLAALKRVARTRQAYVDRYEGFYDMVVPL